VRRKLSAGLVLLALLLIWDAPSSAADPSDGPCSQVSPEYTASAPSAFDALGVPAAWQYSTGQGVTVAVVDSGVAAGNAHLAGAVLPGIDLTGASGDGRRDSAGLGTAIAGVVAAREVDTSGLSGVAPGAMILPVRAYSDKPAAGAVARGIAWAADHGAKVIVVPSTFTEDSPELRAAVAHASNLGSLVVAAVGDLPQNSKDQSPRYPAAYDSVLAVTALNAAGVADANALHNDTVQVAAPGAQVLSTYYQLGDCLFAADKGLTAFAAGYVAGVAALVAARYPAETPQMWRYRILVTALRPAPAVRDDDIGWGVVAPVAALTFINDGTAPGPVNPLGAGPIVPDRPSAQPNPPVSSGLPSRDRWAIGICTGLAALVWVLVMLRASSNRRQRAG